MFLRFYRFHSLQIQDLAAWDTKLRKQVFTRLDSLMFGVVGSYFYMDFQQAWQRYKFSLLLMGMLGFIIAKFNLFEANVLGLYYCVFSFSTFSLATLLVLPYFSSIKSGKGFLYKYFT